ncbi:hypothetical protein TeGR_g8491 [Tetraparma gracilis]|uniref:asparagine--tRNA ligase n=1 Tax=Tetraparma gracilis TaxID=2962635 RepID=A0ABQ6M9I3_9STRA|nr:hypothetical protein TeGR_g8491 [Tetraparma gracilis]
MSYTLSISPPSLSSPLLPCLRLALSLSGVSFSEQEGEVKHPTVTGVALTCPDGTVLGQATAILRFLSSLAPYANLYGPGDSFSSSQVDQWLSTAVSSLLVPLTALKSDAALAPRVKKDVEQFYGVLDAHLATRTYLACEYLTAADLLLGPLLTAAAEAAPPGDRVNLSRYHATVLAAFPSSDPSAAAAASTPAAAAAAAAKPGHSGLSLSGVPPPVTTQLFKRERTRIKELLSLPAGSAVTVSGWARTVRSADAGKLLFVELNDGSCAACVQCVVDKDAPGFDAAKPAKSGGTGASFTVKGTLVESQGKGQGLEVKASSVKLLGAVMGGNAEGTVPGGALYPLAKKGHSLEHLRENAHLRARTKLHAAAMRIRHAMAFATHKFFNDQGFLYIHTPIVTCADCEGAGEQFAVTTLLTTDPHKLDLKLPTVLAPEVPKEEEAAAGGEEGGEKKELSTKAKKKAAKKAASEAKRAAAAAATKMRPDPVPQPVGSVDYGLDFFQKRANLTVSGQLNVETHACALSDVYTFGPTFRAENSHTTRHLAEFWMIEPEVAFADLEMDIDLAEDFIKYCVKYALETCAEDLEFFETSEFGEKGLRDRLRNVSENPFKRLNYTEGIEILQQHVKDGKVFEESNIVWGMDLGSEHERYLCEVVFKKPVVLMNYPKEIKSFYMKLNEDNKTVAAADILVPKIGELVGGSAREERFDVLRERCIECGLEPDAVWWYLELRKFGTIKHAGFGLGFERLILFITGLENIKDVIPFPRAPGLAEF